MLGAYKLAYFGALAGRQILGLKIYGINNTLF